MNLNKGFIKKLNEIPANLKKFLFQFFLPLIESHNKTIYDLYSSRFYLELKFR